MHEVLAGLAAGAAGTTALDAVTYADMLLRGRPPSEVPAKTAEALAEKAGVPFGADARARARREATGALLGRVAGLGTGALYGLLRTRVPHAPVALAAVGLGAMAMIAGDLPPIAARATDVRTWGASGWIADVVPHLAYGIVAAAVFEALAPRHAWAFRRLA